VRPTDNVVNTALQAQSGWNYEAGVACIAMISGLRWMLRYFIIASTTLLFAATSDDTEYYINAGGTNQTGFEFAFSDWLIGAKQNGFIRGYS